MSFLSQPITLFPIQPKRQIGTITVDVIVNESTNDTLTITKQPVQQGASIADHAFMEPTIYSCTILQQSNLSLSLTQIYQNFLTLQQGTPAQKGPVAFNIVTPKRIYTNMLMASLSVTTDKKTENILSITASFQQVIFVTVSVVNVPRIQQSNPGSTGATQNAGKKSALVSLKEGLQASGLRIPGFGG